MVLLWPLAALDLLAAMFMLLLHFDLTGGRAALPFALYLIIKGIAFKDPGSIGDMIIGIYMIGMLALGLHTFLVYIFTLYLIQKAAFSFMAYLS